MHQEIHTNRYKIAVIITSLGAGGAERVAVNQVDYLAGRGHSVTLITLEGDSPDHYSIKNPNVVRKRFARDNAKILFEYIDQAGFDTTIDHIHWNEDHYAFFEAMGESDNKLIIFDHNSYFYPLFFDWRRQMFRVRAKVYENADAVTCLTRHACRLFRQKSPNAVLMPNALSYQSNAIANIQGNKNIVAVGNWQRSEKRLDRLLEVFRQVTLMEPEASLTIVGTVFQHEIEDLSESLGIERDKVNAVGKQEDVEQYYLKARLCLMVSEVEGFGLVLTEAASHGLPRVAMAIPGLEDVIDHGSDGYLCPQGDVETCARYVQDILHNDELAIRLGRNALASTKAFNIDIIGARWEWLIDTVVNADRENVLKAIEKDCETNDVTTVDLKTICADYDAQIESLIRGFNQSGLPHHSAVGIIRELQHKSQGLSYHSKIARVLNDISVYFESRSQAKYLRRSEYFDSNWYRQQYPDVASAHIDPALHYVLYGAAEGRDPGPFFGTDKFLKDNSGLLVSGANPLLYFEQLKIRTTPAVSKQLAATDELLLEHNLLENDQLWLDKFTADPGPLTILEPDWIGIRQSSAQFTMPHHTLEIKDDLNELATDYFAYLVVNAKPQKIVIQGFPLRYENLLKKIRKSLPDVTVYCIYHGSFVQQRIDYERSSLQTLFKLHKEGIIKRIGFVKEGMDLTFRELGADAAFIMNFIGTVPASASLVRDKSIGIIGSEWNERKPLFQQIAACKLFDHDEIRIVGSENYGIDFCRLMNITATHLGTISQASMVDFLGGNALNLYVTLSECAPMVPLESLSLGVPCLFGPNNHFFRDNEYLRSRLVVEIPDSELCIAQTAKRALREREKIISEYIAYARQYNVKAKESFSNFIEE